MKLAIAILVLGSVEWAQNGSGGGANAQLSPSYLPACRAEFEAMIYPVYPNSDKGAWICRSGQWKFMKTFNPAPQKKQRENKCTDCRLPPRTVTSVAPLYDTSHPTLNSPNCYDQPDGSTFCLFEKSSDQKTELGIVVTDKSVHVAPLKCGKYQHVDTVIDCSEAKNGHVLCPFDDAPTKQTCADDIHPLTEREWQELMIRMRKLESRRGK